MKEKMSKHPLALSGSVFCVLRASLPFLTSKHFPSVLEISLFDAVLVILMIKHFIQFHVMSFYIHKVKKKSVLVSYTSDLIYIFYCTRQMGED